jgi:hypothetical protein
MPQWFLCPVFYGSIVSGKVEGSDSHGEGLRKILYHAYHMLKKVKYAQMSTCRHFQICRVIPPE